MGANLSLAVPKMTSTQIFLQITSESGVSDQFQVSIVNNRNGITYTQAAYLDGGVYPPPGVYPLNLADFIGTNSNTFSQDMITGDSCTFQAIAVSHGTINTVNFNVGVFDQAIYYYADYGDASSTNYTNILAMSASNYNLWNLSFGSIGYYTWYINAAVNVGTSGSPSPTAVGTIFYTGTALTLPSSGAPGNYSYNLAPITILYYSSPVDASLHNTNYIATQHNNYLVGSPNTGSISGYGTSWTIFDPFTGATSGTVTNGAGLNQGGTYSLYPAGGGSPPCFTAGTHILTESGYKVVESLTNEDRVTTADGRHVRMELYKIPLKYTTIETAPYRIEAGAFGPSYPPRELCVSPLHAILDNKGVWHIPHVAAKHNANITQVDVGKPITYYHIECPDFYRDNLIAEGAVVESFKNRQGTRDIVYEWVEELNGFRRLPKEEQRSVSTPLNTIVVY